MKSKLSLFLTSAFLLGVVACTKTSSVSPDPSPTITLNGGTAIKLTGLSRASFINNSFDSIIVVNSNATDTTLFTNLSNLSSVPSSVNFASFTLSSKTSLAVGSYTMGGGNVARLVIGAQIGGQRYVGVTPLPCTINIDTLTTKLITGTYTATEINSANFTSNSVAGRFRANIY